MKFFSNLIDALGSLVVAFIALAIVAFLGFGIGFGGFSAESSRPKDIDAFKYYYSAIEQAEDFKTFEKAYAGASVAEMTGKIKGDEYEAIEELFKARADEFKGNDK